MIGAVECRPLHPGMGQAVAERTILRKLPDDIFETWSHVAQRVALGSVSLLPEVEDIRIGEEPALKLKDDALDEFYTLRAHIAKATTLMSGRHLQHGDGLQNQRNMEMFTNCATAPTNYLLFYLLLNGSGVGRCYDDDMMLVNWDNAPNIRCVLDKDHPDFDFSAHESSRDAQHKYGNGKDVLWFEVPDTREGWAKALEIWENSAFEKVHKDKMLILDFSKVRARGEPIHGMQDRPASGPVPVMNAFHKAATLKGAGLDRWLQNMYIDHYFAECVLVGGARRAARLSGKIWRDKNIFEFIKVKRPIEFETLSVNEIIEYRKRNSSNGFLWSSNNSVLVDEEFWTYVYDYNITTPLAKHARKVFDMVMECTYADGTGEPGFVNIDHLVQNSDGIEDLKRGDYVGSFRYQPEDDTQVYMGRIARKAQKKKLYMIVNPCGEVALNLLGGFCVVADVVPFHAYTFDEAEEAFRATARALVRVNTMRSIYPKEVQRTNRIGVSITGVHEFAWKFFRVGFKHLINPDFESTADIDWDCPYMRAAEFWRTMARFSNAVADEADRYSAELGLPAPHTLMTVKPAGTTAKLFGLTEGWHLPAMMHYMRWVQFRNDDPLIEEYRKRGYPVRMLQQYRGHTIVGFPTEPAFAKLDMPEELRVTAAEASPEDQYRWIMLGEEWFLNGGPEGHRRGNQISYTLKYNPETVSLKHLCDMMRKYQSKVSACTVMPQEDNSAYEYLPEQPITKVDFEKVARNIQHDISEDVDRVHVDCKGAACPIDFNEGSKHNVNGSIQEAGFELCPETAAASA